MNLIENALAIATDLHKDVIYGGGLNMLDQVKRTAELIQENTQSEDKESVLIAAYLHKSQETKRISEGKAPISLIEIAQKFGYKTAKIVSELSFEPEEDKNQTKTEQWQEKTKWAKGLSKESQEILLAEKICNFETSCNNPNPKKAPSWHIEYFNTRMIMVDALKEANPKLYEIARDLSVKGIQIQQAKQLEQYKLPRANEER